MRRTKVNLAGPPVWPVWLAGIAAALLAGACLDAGTTRCASGLRCPAGSVCTADQSGCTSTSCGNGIVESGPNPEDQEVCDDGNVRSGDGCRGDCRSEETCGNNIVDAHLGEECDLGDENSDLGGLCSLGCEKLCTGERLDPGEQCDYPLFGVSCLDFGYHRGSIACRRCEPVLGGCGMIGWVRMDRPEGLGDLNDVWGVNPRTVFAVGQEADDEVSTVALYDGRSWSIMPMEHTRGVLHGVWASELNDAFAVGEGGRILRYDGAAWVRLSAGTGVALRDVWSGGPEQDVLVVGDEGTVLRFVRGSSGWVPEPLPAGLDGEPDGKPIDLLGVWGSGPEDVFAVGEDGTILHRDGDGWTAMAVDTAEHLQGVWGSGPEHVFAVGQSGTSALYDGHGWSSLEPGTDLHLAGVWGQDGELVAVGQSGMILEYQGLSWANRKPRPASQALHRIWARASNDVHALASSEPYLLHFDGQQWRAVREGAPELPALLPPDTGGALPLRDLWGSQAGDLYVVGEGGTILHRAPAGTWSRADLDPAVSGATFAGVWGTEDGHVYVVGDAPPGGGDAVILHHDGQTWERMPAGTGAALLDVWGLRADDVVAVGEGGRILRYDGQGWQRVSVSSDEALHGVWGNAEAFYAVGSGGTVLQRFRGSWRELLRGDGSSSWRAVWGRSSTDLYVTGAGGTIFHLTSEGWSPLASRTDQELRAVWGVESEAETVQSVMFAGEGGAFLRLLESKEAGAY